MRVMKCLGNKCGFLRTVILILMLLGERTTGKCLVTVEKVVVFAWCKATRTKGDVIQAYHSDFVKNYPQLSILVMFLWDQLFQCQATFVFKFSWRAPF